jgi:hypothetical protein
MAYPIDIESETLKYEGEWFTREELAHKIRLQLEAGDYTVVTHAQALEYLVQALAQTRVLSLKVMPDMLERVNQEAARQSRSVGGIVRDALAAYLGIATPDKPGQVAEPVRKVMPTGRRPTDPDMPAADFDVDAEMQMIDDTKGPKTREMPSVVVNMDEPSAGGKPAVAFAPVNGKQH